MKHLPLDELQDQIEETLQQYIGGCRERSKEKASPLANYVCGFFDRDFRDSILYYTQAATMALQALTDPTIAAPMQKQMGVYHYSLFAQMLTRLVELCYWIERCEESKAELTLYLYDSEGMTESARKHMETDLGYYRGLLNQLQEQE